MAIRISDHDARTFLRALLRQPPEREFDVVVRGVRRGGADRVLSALLPDSRGFSFQLEARILHVLQPRVKSPLGS